MKLPEKQAKRIYARYYLGMTVNEIAEVEGVDTSRVRAVSYTHLDVYKRQALLPCYQLIAQTFNSYQGYRF